tara:strand:+ start:265 stop:507 length:243 start_codon:yes stop_codon:yes gene_type:complete
MSDFTVVRGTNQRVVELIANRLEVGQKKYAQDMQLEDGRDMIQESLEELLDACVYIATELIKLQDKVGRYRSNGYIGRDY